MNTEKGLCDFCCYPFESLSSLNPMQGSERLFGGVICAKTGDADILMSDGKIVYRNITSINPKKDNEHLYLCNRCYRAYLTSYNGAYDPTRHFKELTIVDRAVVTDENIILPECHLCKKEMSVVILDKKTVYSLPTHIRFRAVELGYLKQTINEDEYSCAVCLKCVKVTEKEA